MSYIQKNVDKILHFGGTDNSLVQRKVDKLYKGTHETNNPFLNKDGSLVNPYINYQAVLDNPNTNNKVKSFITSATNLVETPKPVVAPIQAQAVKVQEPKLTAPVQKESSETYTGNTYIKPQQTQTTASNGKLGYISAKYETGGYNGGAVSSGAGDYGGVSYGIPQFSTKTGSADTFVSWLKENKPEIGKLFGTSKAGSKEFSNAWKQAYSQYGDTFSNIQTNYAYDRFVKPLATLAMKKTGIDYTRSPALKELIYSTAIQFGGGSLGLSALGNVNSNMSDADIVNASYDKKIANYQSFFKSSSKSVQESVKNRFKRERNDVLSLLN